MKEVKNMILPDGSTYSGAVESDGYMDVPHGMGICKYSDHNESGMFQNGELNGIAYLNYHEWMSVGVAKNGVINGWGLRIDRGIISFGVFKDSILKINLTPLVKVFWKHILELSTLLNRNAISVLKSGKILVGVPETILKGKMGFQFLENGEVFLGTYEMGHSDITGYFLHFDLDYNITRGAFVEGKLVREISAVDLIRSFGVFFPNDASLDPDNKAYLDFNINLNYAPYKNK